MEILNVRALDLGYLVNGLITILPTDADYAQVIEWVNDGKEVIPKYTQAELDAIADALKPKEVSRAQFFAALIISNLDIIVDNAVMNSGDKLLINDYKNRLTFRRDWPSFITMATALGKTDAEIDALFLLASAQ